MPNARNWEYRRINTLIPYRAPEWRPSSKLPSLKESDSTWVTCGKLGRHLLSSATADQRAELAIDAYRRVYARSSATLERVDPESLEGLERSCVRDVGGDPLVFRDADTDGLVVVPESSAKKKYLGRHTWYYTRRVGSERADVTCFKLKTAVGILALVDSLPEEGIRELVTNAQDEYLSECLERVTELKSQWARRDDGLYMDPASTSEGRHYHRALNLDFEEGRIRAQLDWVRGLASDPQKTHQELLAAIDRLLMETKGLGAFEDPMRLGRGLVALEEEFWGEEMNRDLNRRYDDRVTHGHSATVWQDKRNLDPDHVAAARSGFIGKSFSHVEIDDDVDLDEYAQMQGEFLRRFSSREVPQVDLARMEFRLRKCGRHHAIGVYSPTLNTVVVDPRRPVSLIHEFAHAYDFSHGQLSCSQDFRAIVSEVSASLAREDLSQRMYEYAVTPTEVFARSWEVYASTRGFGGSFVRTPGEYAGDVLYAPLVEMSEKVCDYFDATIPVEERPRPIEASEREVVERAAREALAAVSPESLREPDFTGEGDGARVDEERWAAAREGQQFSLFDLAGANDCAR